jgi:hypothetical protein
MALVGKWDESGTLRSYIMDIYGVSGYFGDGSDGALTISVDTTEAPIDSACTGTSGTYVLSATNVSFAIGQQILIHQTQGINAGQNERNVITGYTAGTITLQTPLVGTYGTSGAQVRVFKQYTNVTINSGKTYTAKAWNGTVGGILGFLASGTVTVTGTISASGCGFRGGAGAKFSATAVQGEGLAGIGASSQLPNTTGGGGSFQDDISGGGGGHAVAGSGDGGGNGGDPGNAGTDTADLTTAQFGGGGGGGLANASSSASAGGTGGNGGGIVYVTGTTITVTGSIVSDGASGANGAGTVAVSGGGGGAGGAILLKVQTATLGASFVTAGAGTGGLTAAGGAGYSGSYGRIHLDYYTSYTGSTSPTLDVIQDNTLVTTATYQARIGISQNGSASEYLTKNFPSLTTAQWNRLSISWASASSLATFYLNGDSLGATTGTKTAIHDNASLLYIGANKGASAIQNYLNGYIDDVRVWGAVRSAADIYTYNNIQLTGNEGSLKAYYKLNNAATDSGPSANNLTLRNSSILYSNCSVC